MPWANTNNVPEHKAELGGAPPGSIAPVCVPVTWDATGAQRPASGPGQGGGHQ